MPDQRLQRDGRQRRRCRRRSNVAKRNVDDDTDDVFKVERHPSVVRRVPEDVVWVFFDVVGVGVGVGVEHRLPDDVTVGQEELDKLCEEETQAEDQVSF